LLISESKYRLVKRIFIQRISLENNALVTLVAAQESY